MLGIFLSRMELDQSGRDPEASPCGQEGAVVGFLSERYLKCAIVDLSGDGRLQGRQTFLQLDDLVVLCLKHGSECTDILGRGLWSSTNGREALEMTEVFSITLHSIFSEFTA